MRWLGQLANIVVHFDLLEGVTPINARVVAVIAQRRRHLVLQGLSLLLLLGGEERRVDVVLGCSSIATASETWQHVHGR